LRDLIAPEAGLSLRDFFGGITEVSGLSACDHLINRENIHLKKALFLQKSTFL